MTIIIDNHTYNVPVISVDESGDFLYKYAERTEDGVLHSELIGVYYNYKLKFGSPASTVALAALWVKLSEPSETHTIIVPDADGADYTFTCYFANVKRTLRKWGAAQTFWKELSVDLISISPSRT